MQQVGRKRTIFCLHRTSLNTHHKEAEQLKLYTWLWLNTLSAIPPNMKSYNEFTTFLNNRPSIRDLHPWDLLHFLQRPKLQKGWIRTSYKDTFLSNKNGGKFLFVFGEELRHELSSIFSTLQVFLPQWNKYHLNNTTQQFQSTCKLIANFCHL